MRDALAILLPVQQSKLAPYPEQRRVVTACRCTFLKTDKYTVVTSASAEGTVTRMLGARHKLPTACAAASVYAPATDLLCCILHRIGTDLAQTVTRYSVNSAKAC